MKLCLSYPVLTFASGQTNSMRGAAFLALSNLSGLKNFTEDQLKNALVVDIGGTSSDVGQLVNGFPRPASNRVQVTITGKFYIADSKTRKGFFLRLEVCLPIFECQKF